jgi:ABC-type uncharacterized transport system substrate-binding protein
MYSSESKFTLNLGGVIMRKVEKVFIVVFMMIFLLQIPVLAADKKEFATNPKTNNGKKWRIGYYEGGEYIAYQQFLEEAAKGMMKLGWIETTDFPSWNGEQTKDLWNWLSKTVRSDYIEFVANAHYTAQWDDKLRVKTAEKVIKRLNSKKDIDLIIAMGTWAGQDLANDQHSVPTIVLSASDAVGAGIVKSIENSGRDHVFSRVDPYRYERQLRTFHDVVGFKTLGIAYEDTVSGRSIAAVEKVEKVAEEREFKIVRCFTKDDVPDRKIAEATVKQCFHTLGNRKVDAIYATVQNGINSDSVTELVDMINSYAIPTFSQFGSKEVEWGFLLSLSQASYKYVGEFNAKVIAKVFNGAKPRQLDQLFEAPPKIAINLKTAEIIGFNPPVDVMLAADQIYHEIETPDSQ